MDPTAIKKKTFGTGNLGWIIYNNFPLDPLVDTGNGTAISNIFLPARPSHQHPGSMHGPCMVPQQRSWILKHRVSARNELQDTPDSRALLTRNILRRRLRPAKTD